VGLAGHGRAVVGEHVLGGVEGDDAGGVERVPSPRKVSHYLPRQGERLFGLSDHPISKRNDEFQNNYVLSCLHLLPQPGYNIPQRDSLKAPKDPLRLSRGPCRDTVSITHIYQGRTHL
jgi:hypothetical protein